MLRLALLACLSFLALPVSAQQAQESSQDQAADAQKSEVDCMINVGARIGSDAQAYYLKPREFGGGAGSFDDLSLAAIEFSVDDVGRHIRSSCDGTGTQIFTLAKSDAGITIRGTSDQSDRIVWVVVTGPDQHNLAVRVTQP
ncbi:MAG: hypothetical protein AAF845_12950 [Bacteroidota bacterium]